LYEIDYNALSHVAKVAVSLYKQKKKESNSITTQNIMTRTNDTVPTHKYNPNKCKRSPGIWGHFSCLMKGTTT